MSEWTDLVVDVQEWQRETFTQATPESAAKHLLREAGELADCPRDDGEMADVLILLLNIAGLTDTDLIAAARVKMEENRRRTWGKPDADGVVEHVS